MVLVSLAVLVLALAPLQFACADHPIDPVSTEDTTASGVRGVSDLDALLEEQLTRWAAERGIDPITVLPDPALREAARRSGSLDSREGQELLQVYTDAFARLGR